MVGNPDAAQSISQTVAVSGAAGDSFILSGWAQGISAPLRDARKFGLRLTFNHTDGSTNSQEVSFNEDYRSADYWQYAATPAVAAEAYSSVKVEVLYDYNVNTVFFDGIQLFKENFGTSYTYDGDGNVISMVDLQKQTTTYEYQNNNLTKIIKPSGTLTYTYDNYHNVKTATAATGEVYSFEYDAYGNNTSVSVGSGTKKITTSAVYENAGNTLKSTTDAIGNVTTYCYNASTNVLEWVQYPNDTATKRTTYTYDAMYRLARAALTTDTNLNLSVEYTFNNDLLTYIKTPTTVYAFTYGAFSQRSSVKVGGKNLATYTYTSDENRYLSQLAYGNGDRVQYTYDDLGRVIKETYEDGATVSYQYDNSGALASVTDSATGITTTYYYDFTGRTMKYVESGSGYSHSVGYEYDVENLLTALVETINGVERTTQYTYDDSRLKLVNVNGMTRNYFYDEYGRVCEIEDSIGSSLYRTISYTFTGTTAATSTQIASIRVVHWNIYCRKETI